ncbi:MAG: hypothetical protein J5685_04745 [Clostridiales bacterium]|nr:hypothetical protein [Clostridiales bacterium]
MIYTKEELTYLDIMWYGIDRYGKLFVACSGGVGYIPEYIINDRYNNEHTCYYLLYTLPIIGTTKFLRRLKKNCDMRKEYDNLAKHGIWCFDVDFSKPNVYELVAKPSCSLIYSDVVHLWGESDQIQIFDIDIAASKKIELSSEKIKILNPNN